MNQRTYRPICPTLAAIILLLIVLLTGSVLCVHQAQRLLTGALDGRRMRAQDSTHISEFALRMQMNSQQAQSRLSGWRSVVAEEEIRLSLPSGERMARVYPPVRAQEPAPWAIVLHGGLGTCGAQLEDVACALSIEGYRVLLPDLYAHGGSEGALSSMNLQEDVRAWVSWVMQREPGASIVVYGMDEGGAAALLAEKELPDAVKGIAVDSVYKQVGERARQMLRETKPDASRWEEWLFEKAYRFAFGVPLTEGDVCEAVRGGDMPLLVIHAASDQDVPAWHGEDVAAAAGDRAQLLMIEGAVHGLARFAQPQTYYDALFAFFDDALVR